MLYKRDVLSVVGEAFRESDDSLTCRRHDYETMKTSENRFNALGRKLHSTGQTTKLPECITSLLLPANAQIIGTQHVIVLDAAATYNTDIATNAPNDQFLQAVSYNAVSAVAKHCDSIQKTKLQIDTASAGRLDGNNDRTHNENSFKRLFQTEKDTVWIHAKYHRRGTYAHFERQQQKNGSVISGYNWYYEPPRESVNNGTIEETVS